VGAIRALLGYDIIMLLSFTLKGHGWCSPSVRLI